MAGEAAELLFAGKHGRHLLLAGQQRQLDVPELLPGGIGYEVRLIRGEVGDPLLQPLQRPGDVAHQPDAEADAAEQQGQPDQPGRQVQLILVGIQVVVGVVVEHQIEQPLTGRMGPHQEVFVLVPQHVFVEARALVGLEPDRQAAGLGPVAGELARAGGGGRHAEPQPVVAVAGHLRLQPVAQAELLHLVLGHHHQQADDDQQQQAGTAQGEDQATAQAGQAHDCLPAGRFRPRWRPVMGSPVDSPGRAGFPAWEQGRACRGHCAGHRCGCAGRRSRAPRRPRRCRAPPGG